MSKQSTSKIFTEIYDKKIWGQGSGTGSRMSRNNKKYIDVLEELIKTYKIKSICDIGCGDWEFSHHINFSGIKYLGLDCVDSVIKANTKKYKKRNISFAVKSITASNIPKKFDMIILKDVIQHWTDKEIVDIFAKILKENKYVFCTNGYKFMKDPKKNTLKKRDISNKYRYHPVDIDKPPFSKFKSKCIFRYNYFSKQMLLFKY